MVLRGYVKLSLEAGECETLVKPVIAPRRLLRSFDSLSKPIIALLQDQNHALIPAAPSSGISLLRDALPNLIITSSNQEVLEALISSGIQPTSDGDVSPIILTQSITASPSAGDEIRARLTALEAANRDLTRSRVILLDAALPPHLSFFIKDFLIASDHDCFPKELLASQYAVAESVKSLLPSADIGTIIDLFRQVVEAIKRTSEAAFPSSGSYSTARSSADEYTDFLELLDLLQQLNPTDIVNVGDVAVRRFGGLFEESDQHIGSLPIMLVRVISSLLKGTINFSNVRVISARILKLVLFFCGEMGSGGFLASSSTEAEESAGEGTGLRKRRPSLLDPSSLVDLIRRREESLFGDRALILFFSAVASFDQLLLNENFLLSPFLSTIHTTASGLKESSDEVTALLEYRERRRMMEGGEATGTAQRQSNRAPVEEFRHLKDFLADKGSIMNEKGDLAEFATLDDDLRRIFLQALKTLPFESQPTFLKGITWEGLIALEGEVARLVDEGSVFGQEIVVGPTLTLPPVPRGCYEDLTIENLIHCYARNKDLTGKLRLVDSSLIKRELVVEPDFFVSHSGKGSFYRLVSLIDSYLTSIGASPDTGLWINFISSNQHFYEGEDDKWSVNQHYLDTRALQATLKICSKGTIVVMDETDVSASSLNEWDWSMEYNGTSSLHFVGMDPDFIRQVIGQVDPEKSLAATEDERDRIVADIQRHNSYNGKGQYDTSIDWKEEFKKKLLSRNASSRSSDLKSNTFSSVSHDQRQSYVEPVVALDPSDDNSNLSAGQEEYPPEMMPAQDERASYGRSSLMTIPEASFEAREAEEKREHDEMSAPAAVKKTKKKTPSVPSYMAPKDSKLSIVPKPPSKSKTRILVQDV